MTPERPNKKPKLSGGLSILSDDSYDDDSCADGFVMPRLQYLEGTKLQYPVILLQFEGPPSFPAARFVNRQLHDEIVGDRLKGKTLAVKIDATGSDSEGLLVDFWHALFPKFLAGYVRVCSLEIRCMFKQWLQMRDSMMEKLRSMWQIEQLRIRFILPYPADAAAGYRATLAPILSDDEMEVMIKTWVPAYLRSLDADFAVLDDLPCIELIQITYLDSRQEPTTTLDEYYLRSLNYCCQHVRTESGWNKISGPTSKWNLQVISGSSYRLTNF